MDIYLSINITRQRYLRTPTLSLVCVDKTGNQERPGIRDHMNDVVYIRWMQRGVGSPVYNVVMNAATRDLLNQAHMW